MNDNIVKSVKFLVIAAVIGAVVIAWEFISVILP